MRRHGKASTAGSTSGQAGRIGRIVHGVLADPAASSRGGGSGAPSVSPRAKLLLSLAAAVALTLILGVALATATAPVVTVEDATNVGYTSADVKGHVNPEGQSTSWRFQYATEADFSNAQDGPSGSTETEEDVSGQFTGLQPGTLYHLRLLAENGDGQSEAVAASTFETLPGTKPTVGEPQVSSITGHTAHFEGTVSTNSPEAAPASADVQAAFNTHWWFTCEPSCSFSGPSQGDVEADTSPATVEADATSLPPNKEITVILHATNAAGEESESAVFTTSAIEPDVTGAPFGAFDPTADEATVYGFVNPNNSEVTDCHFVYGVGTASGNEVPCEPAHVGVDEVQFIDIPSAAESGQFEVTFESATTEPMDVSVDGGTLQSELEALPTIGPDNVSVLQIPFESWAYTNRFRITFEGDLSATDVPLLEASEVEVEPGVFVSIGTGLEGIKQGGIGTSAEVRARVTDLEPGSEYRYRLVATNGAGTSEGSERWFRTLEPAEAETCSNQDRRDEQKTTAAECRAYEMVSPLDKNNANVVGEGVVLQVATDGDGVVFKSRGGFAEATGSGSAAFNAYLSRRDASGWSTKGITPTPAPDASQVFLTNTIMDVFSDDLRHAVLWGYDLPGVEDALPKEDNYYRLDTETGALQTMTPLSQMLAKGPPGFPEWVSRPLRGASSDAGVVSYASKKQFDARVEPLVENAYEWDHGTLRLAGILPDGSVPAAGSRPPVLEGGTYVDYRQTVSSDGSRVLFESRAAGGQWQLYMRRDHSNTVWISEPEGTAVEPENLDLQWVSDDADKVLFVTPSQLLPEDENFGPDLYLYDDGPNPESESNLTMVTTEGDAYGAGTVVGATEDASRIYFIDYLSTLKLWDRDGETTRYILPNFDTEYNVHRVSNSPGKARVSADGRVVAFFKKPDYGSFYGLTGALIDPSGEKNQMYVFDALSNTLSCASCVTDGFTDHGISDGGVVGTPNVTNAGLKQPFWGVRPDFLSQDGSRAFFSTAAALVPEDTNGVTDTYVYDTRTGRRRLVSTGKSGEGEWFANATPSGDDVILLTADQMLGRDRDHLVDAYDARVGGGFVEPPPPPTPCSGDGCRNALSEPLSGQSPATSGFSGPGNQPGKRRCARGKVRHRGKCVKRRAHRKQRQRRAKGARR